MSPLLFCLGLKPLISVIDKTGYRYQLRNGATIRHLHYMDGM